MHVSNNQKPPHIQPVQVDFFLDPPPKPPSVKHSQTTDKQATQPATQPAQITVVEPKQPAPSKRLKPVGVDRFYDIVHQFEPAAEQGNLTKAEFRAADRLDQQQPEDDDGESDQQLVRQLSEAMHDEESNDDDAEIIDVFTMHKEDSAGQRLAKAMFSRMLFDLAAIKPTSADVIDEGDLDIFGQPSISNRKSDYTQLRKYDALIWIFDLNPDKPIVTFSWVCEQLGFDENRIRRITARSVKKDLRQVLRFIAGMVEHNHARACEHAMSEYINLENWHGY